MISWDLHITRPGGFVVGDKAAVMVRELVLFRADLSPTAWFRDCAPAPVPVLPAGVSLHWLSLEDWRERCRAGPTDAATAEERYRAGARCLAGRGASGHCVSQLWASEKAAHVAWIGEPVAPPPGHLLVFDAWVDADHRGGNLHWAGAAEACAEARRRGLEAIAAGVEAHEFPSFAAKYASFGLVVIEPYRDIVVIKAFGARASFSRAPARHLVALAAALKARYPDLAGGNGHERRLRAAAP